MTTRAEARLLLLLWTWEWYLAHPHLPHAGAVLDVALRRWKETL